MKKDTSLALGITLVALTGYPTTRPLSKTLKITEAVSGRFARAKIIWQWW